MQPGDTALFQHVSGRNRHPATCAPLEATIALTAGLNAELPRRHHQPQLDGADRGARVAGVDPRPLLVQDERAESPPLV